MDNNEKIGIMAFILALICLSAVYNLSTTNAYNNYTTINNYTNITQGGGGVSFDGSTVNLNGSFLINGTFSNLNDTKLNKTGDNINGVATYYYSNHPVFDFNTLARFKRNFSYSVWNGTAWDNELRIMYAALSVIAQNNDGPIVSGGGPGLGFYADNKSSTTGDNLDYMGRVGIVWDSKEIGSTKIQFIGKKNWADTYAFTYTGLEVYGSNQTVKVLGNIHVGGLVGTGNVYACISANGTLYRGNPTC